ncbi:MAG TPA: aldo/keto reductase [Verrucomicrobiae bacterium]|nr:aldo/keto reductase [Verrucomicrobiae bacterium]
MSLSTYVTLGRSGLKISALSLGTMTFGGTTGWGTDEASSRQIFLRYLEQGGNFIDTADGYADGRSEEMVGKFVLEGKLRDQVVLATKYSFNTGSGNPNSGGNGRKNIYRALENSLRRLKTDYIDLYWQHVWDRVTPAEEVVFTFDDLVRDGKIRYYGFSDVPAWYVARAYTVAEKETKERLIALQLEYSLVERNIEREHIPAAQELGLGVCPWSPLAGGFLSGKYKRDESGGKGEGRLETLKNSPNPVMRKFTERNWRILDALLDVANHLEKPLAQVALNWTVTQPGITSTIIGATKIAQLDDNIASLAFTIPTDLRSRLDGASALEMAHPYIFFGDFIQARVTGDVPVEAWAPNCKFATLASTRAAGKSKK